MIYSLENTPFGLIRGIPRIRRFRLPLRSNWRGEGPIDGVVGSQFTTGLLGRPKPSVRSNLSAANFTSAGIDF